VSHLGKGCRGTGRTTSQLKKLPHGATFFWCTSDTSYPKSLAKHLNREDIKIFPLTSLATPHKFYGIQYFYFELDHAALSFLTNSQFRGYRELQERYYR
jgi:hypothetical protein